MHAEIGEPQLVQGRQVLTEKENEKTRRKVDQHAEIDPDHGAAIQALQFRRPQQISEVAQRQQDQHKSLGRAGGRIESDQLFKEQAVDRRRQDKKQDQQMGEPPAEHVPVDQHQQGELHNGQNMQQKKIVPVKDRTENMGRDANSGGHKHQDAEQALLPPGTAQAEQRKKAGQQGEVGGEVHQIFGQGT